MVNEALQIPRRYARLHVADRSFGGTRAVRASAAKKQDWIAEYRSVADAITPLEEKQSAMWRARKHKDTLDEWQLYREVEQRAHSPDATQEDQIDFGTLLALREKEDVIANITIRCPAEYVKGSSELIVSPTTDGPSKAPFVDGARFWAVIIGINHYETLGDLAGAYPDALSMHRYLTRDLSVPSDHIRLLLSPKTEDALPDETLLYERPTRTNILSALYDHLRDNSHIQQNDNILLYFAGHGSCYPVEDTTHTYCADEMEAFCPLDRGCSSPDGLVQDISARELSIILEELRDDKGSNITVITDCCRSVRTSRKDPSPNARASLPLPDAVKNMLLAADADPRRRPGSRRACSSDWDWDATSCVLLTACTRHEAAQESQVGNAWHGQFTRMLLALLREHPEWSYSKLCNEVKERMPTYAGMRHTQNPRAAGRRRRSKVWYVRNELDV